MGVWFSCSPPWESCASLVPRASSSAKFVGTRVKAGRPSDSDHNAILFTLKGGDNNITKLLSWNVLCKYGYNEEFNFPFDGFNRRTEADHDYVARMHRTAAVVSSLVKTHRPHALLLQECAEPGECGHVVITDDLVRFISPLGYIVLHEGEFVTAVRAATAHAVELPSIHRQGGKIYAVRSDELDSVFLNVHLRWDKDQSNTAEQTRQDVQAVIADIGVRFPTARLFLAGDTNRVPTKMHEVDPDASTIEHLATGLGSLCHPPGPTNVRWNGKQRRSELTYADFALECIRSHT